MQSTSRPSTAAGWVPTEQIELALFGHTNRPQDLERAVLSGAFDGIKPLSEFERPGCEGRLLWSPEALVRAREVGARRRSE